MLRSETIATPDRSKGSPRSIEAPYHAIMPTLDLTDDEKAALVAHLRHALEYDPFPFAPRLDPLKAILA